MANMLTSGSVALSRAWEIRSAQLRYARQSRHNTTTITRNSNSAPSNKINRTCYRTGQPTTALAMDRLQFRRLAYIELRTARRFYDIKGIMQMCQRRLGWRKLCNGALDIYWSSENLRVSEPESVHNALDRSLHSTIWKRMREISRKRIEARRTGERTAGASGWNPKKSSDSGLFVIIMVLLIFFNDAQRWSHYSDQQSFIMCVCANIWNCFVLFISRTSTFARSDSKKVALHHTDRDQCAHEYVYASGQLA